MTCKEAIFVMPDLHGPEGNAFFLLGRADHLLKKHDICDEDRKRFRDEAMSGDYAHLLATVCTWFTVAIPKVTYEIIE